MAPQSQRIAVLINTYASPYYARIDDSFTTAITAVSPTTSIEFFDPIEESYPNIESGNYDLIILSGGSEDPMGDAPWVLKEMAWIQETARHWPKQKIMGICWGHQILCRAFGGHVERMEEGAELGVTTISFTGEGSQFFSSVSLSSDFRIHQYHRRKVTSPAKGFVALADGNQCFISASNSIISFQGHPEMNVELVKSMFSTVHSYLGVKEGDKPSIEKRMEWDHDGFKIWERVLEWTKE